MSEPRTAAGRELVRQDPETAGFVLAIEAEAAVPLDVRLAALAQEITNAVNAGELPVDLMGGASVLHHMAHQVADHRDDAAYSEASDD